MDMKSCLESLLEAHRHLLDMANKKKDVLVRGSAKELESTIIQEMELVNKVKELDAARQSLLVDQDMTMAEWIQSQVPETRESLTHLRHELRSTLRDLKELNDLNQMLINHSMSYIQYSLDVMMDDPDEMTYRPVKQSFQAKQGRNFFDTKA